MADDQGTINWFKIIGRNKTFAISTLDFEKDFELEKIKPIQPTSHCSLVQNPNYSWNEEEKQILDLLFCEKSYNNKIFLYNFNQITKTIILSKMPENITKEEILEAPFLYKILKEKIIEIITIPIEKIAKIQEKIDPAFSFQNRSGFFFNTGRCGSTLAGKLFSMIPNFTILQEPDFATNFVFLYPTGVGDDSWPSNEDEKQKLKGNLDSLFTLCHWIQFVSIAGENWENEFVLFKFRSQSNSLMNVYYELLENGKFYFMYRNGIETACSFYKLFIQFPEFWKKMEKDLKIRFNNHSLEIEEIIRNNGEDPSGFYVQSVSVWFDAMLHACKFIEKSKNKLLCFRNEELLSHPHVILNEVQKTVQEALHLTFDQFTAEDSGIKLILSKDSQAGSAVSSQNSKNISVEIEKMKYYFSILNKTFENIPPDVILQNSILSN